MVETVFLGDILDLAIGLEKVGADFYVRASNQTDSAGTRSVLTELARMEQEHGRSFSGLKDMISGGSDLPLETQPDKAAVRYLESWTEDSIGGIGLRYASLTGAESDEDIMRIAIEREKDTIAYYTGLCRLFTGVTREMLDRIIMQEMDHYATLKKTLNTIESLKSKV